MLNFPKISEIRLVKFTIHAIFVSVVLILLTLFAKDIVRLILGHPVQQNLDFISTIMFVIWLLFALRSDAYQKQDNT